MQDKRKMTFTPLKYEIYLAIAERLYDN